MRFLAMANAPRLALAMNVAETVVSLGLLVYFVSRYMSLLLINYRLL